MTNLNPAPFLAEDVVRSIKQEFGTPVFVYDRKTLTRYARMALDFPNPFGLTARYAMKACSTSAVIRVLTDAGLHIDASSGFEVERALAAGIEPGRIQLTTQELPEDLKQLVDRGILFNACSAAQIHAFGKLFPGRETSIRINPGLGSGHNNRTNVGGPSSSFGIWHEHLDEALAIGRRYDLRFTRLHSHIGSGSDPKVWQRVALMSLGVCARVPDVTILNLGGGFKIGRITGEETTDLQKIGEPMADAVKSFAEKYNRKLHLEVEPGTYVVANAGALVATVIDVVDTGRNGYNFLKVDTGMTELLRPGMYGAQHPITLVSPPSENRKQKEYVVVGHCCESGDILTPSPGEPEQLQPRLLPEAQIGDLVVIGAAGAYCAGMAAKNYNSFPESAEVMINEDGTIEPIKKRQTVSQITQNEVMPSFLDS